MKARSALGRRSLAAIPLLAAGLLALAGCATTPSGSGSGSGAGAATLGVVTSTSGSYATQAASFVDGFRSGVSFATGGTDKVGDTQLVTEVKNDNGDPATGVNAAKELLGNGAKLIAGPISSAVALPVADLTAQNGGTFLGGPASSSALFARGANIFNANGGRPMLNAAVLAGLGDAATGKKVAYVGGDYAYGQDAVFQLTSDAAARGIAVVPQLFPTTTTDFTPGALQVRDQAPDIVYVDWQGAGTAQLYAALAQQGLFDSAQVVAHLTPRANYQAVADAAGADVGKIDFIAWYAEGAGGGNAAEQALDAGAQATGTQVDYTHYNGFVAGQMAVRAVQEAGPGLDPAAVSGALTGWSFDSPSGAVTIRAEDHLLMSPMYDYGLQEQGGQWTAVQKARYDGAAIAPPVRKAAGS